MKPYTMIMTRPKRNKKALPQSGFTLIEMLVSIALFAIVMVVCVGALLSLVGANKKAQALEASINNLNISVDDMVRNLREGQSFNVPSNDCPQGNGDTVATDCTTGATAIAFTTFDGDHWVYEYVSSKENSNLLSHCGTQRGAGGCIIRSEDNGATFSSLTSPEVSITDMEFYVIGTAPGCDSGTPSTPSCAPIQPRVIITINGDAGAVNDVKDSTAFHIQATALQRSLDL